MKMTNRFRQGPRSRLPEDKNFSQIGR